MKKKESIRQHNISTIFLLPGIEIDNGLKKSFNQFGFVNTYTTCKSFTFPYKVVYLLFKPVSMDMAFYSFIESLKKNKNFVNELDLGYNRLMVVYKVPTRFNNDYDLFLEGKYSKLSAEFKSCFAMEEWKRTSTGALAKDINNRPIKEPSTFYHVFHRTKEFVTRWKERLGYDPDDDILNDVELYEKQNEEEETYDLGFNYF